MASAKSDPTGFKESRLAILDEVSSSAAQFEGTPVHQKFLDYQAKRRARLVAMPAEELSQAIEAAAQLLALAEEHVCPQKP